MSNVVPVEKKSILVDMANRYGMEAAMFARTLRATVVPTDVSDEQFAAFLMVARQYGLNPITKEVFAFPTRSGGIQPIVSVDGWANLINSHPAMDGMEFADTVNDKGELVSVTCRIYRKDRSRPVEATEYMAECRRNTDTWRQWPRRMLRHKAMIQAARYAFGFAGIIEPDEWERSPEKPAETTVTVPPSPPSPPPAPPPAPVIVAREPDGDSEFADFAPEEEAYRTLAADIDDASTEEEIDAAIDQSGLAHNDSRVVEMRAERLEAIKRKR